MVLVALCVLAAGAIAFLGGWFGEYSTVPFGGDGSRLLLLGLGVYFASLPVLLVVVSPLFRLKALHSVSMEVVSWFSILVLLGFDAWVTWKFYLLLRDGI